MQRNMCVWLMLLLIVIQYIPVTSPNVEKPVTPFSCSEMFNLTDPRNCCSIPYLLPQIIVEACLQIPLSPVAMEGENCRAECVLNGTDILIDGSFQPEAAIERLTSATADDEFLTNRIQYAVTKCYRIVYVSTVTYLSEQCLPSSRYVLDCIFSIMYKRCPLRYWANTDECRQLVLTLNNCPYFLVHSNSF
uniref:OBP47-like domain-containing protein n=1 Tax=Anopheles farauti TaxID=69004 RepID=A0A9I3GJ72_9DIPT